MNTQVVIQVGAVDAAIEAASRFLIFGVTVPSPSAGGAQGVESYDTLDDLLGAAPANSSLGYAEDTGDFYERGLGRWRRVLASEVEGDLATVIAVIGSEEVTLDLDESLTVAANTTLPTNIHLNVRKGAPLLIASGATLTVRGEISAGRWQVFSYASASSAVVFGSGADQRGRTQVYPEWWGALGDGTTDDTTPIQRMWDVAAELEKGLRYWFTAGKSYKVTSTLNYSPGSTATSEPVVVGYGSRLRWHGTTADPVVRVGDQADGKKVFDGRWHGLSIQRSTSVSKVEGSAAIEINRADFFVVRECHFSGFGYGVHYDGEGGNGNSFYDLRITGCTTSWHNQDADNCNVWRIQGGKFQQGQIGVHAKGVGFVLESVDFSLLTVSAAKLENASEGRVHCYTEAIGTLLDANTSKVYHLVDCNRVKLAGMRVNAGGNTYTNNCGYGVYVEGDSAQLDFEDLYFIQPQIADFYFSSEVDGESCRIRYSRHTENGNDMTVEAQKVVRVSDHTSRGVRNHAAWRMLPRLAAPAETPPNAFASVDLSDTNWNLLGGATITGTVAAPFGGGETAQVVDLPNTPYAGNTALVSRLEYDASIDLGEALNGKVVALRYWYKPVSVPTDSIYDLHRAQSYMQRTSGDLDAQGATGVFDGFDGWIFAEHRYAVPTGAGQTMLTVGIRASQYGGDGVRLAIWKPQLVVLDDQRDEVPYIDQRRPALAA